MPCHGVESSLRILDEGNCNNPNNIEVIIKFFIDFIDYLMICYCL